MDMQNVVAILLATIPNILMYLANKNKNTADVGNVTALTIKEYANQVREMRKELADVDKDRRNWQILAEQFERKLEWATDYIERLSHQVKSLGHDPVKPPKEREKKDG